MFTRLTWLLHYVKSRNASFAFALFFLVAFVYIRLPHIHHFVQHNTLTSSIRFISETSKLIEHVSSETTHSHPHQDQEILEEISHSLQQCQQIWKDSFPFTPSSTAPSTLVRAYCFAHTFRMVRGKSMQVLSPLLARAIVETNSSSLFEHWDHKKLMNLALFTTKNEWLWMSHTMKRELRNEWKTATRLMEDLMDDCFFYTEQMILETHILVDLIWDVISFVLLILHFYSYFMYAQVFDPELVS